MKHIARITLALALLLTSVLDTHAASPVVGEGGKVEVPLDVYNALVEAARNPPRLPVPAPARYALGTARVNVNVPSTESRAAAEVRVDLTIEVLEDGWVAVPVLPAGTPVERATVDGAVVQLLAIADGLAWTTKQAGAYDMNLTYRVDATRTRGGYSLPLPLPAAAAINLSASLPGTDLDVSIIPAAGVRTSGGANRTQVEATIPTCRGVQISWRAPSEEGHAVSRARYSGQLSGDAVSWTAELDVELFTAETVMLPLLPQRVTLSDLSIDDKPAPILVEGGSFATPVQGRGRHKIVLSFQSPVVRGEGQPSVEVLIPSVPVSRFDLTLPGKKEVSVTPASNVTNRAQGETTVATVFAPLTSRVVFTWAEAVPEEVRAEVRANAELYHAVHAEEGVLNVQAFVLVEITRGETNLLRLGIPPGVQVNRIVAPSGAVADWRLEDGDGEVGRQVTVFLDRKVREELLLQVHYDRSLGSGDKTSIELPLLTVPEAHRQRGMVALLSSKDLTLKPLREGDATRVGENQLPPFVRQVLGMTVAHTFKYVGQPPQLVVEASEPERQQGRFDAQVDTLISLGEVTLSGLASVEINVKSGRIMELELGAPAGINLLNLTGPSIRSHRIENADGGQQIEVQFTQEMEGQFRLEASYELILGELAADLEVPTLRVEGAEVEQGRLAVEALTAVEVRPVRSDQLTALDISELPQQLILRTTNPILLAYKYVHSESPLVLLLKVTRHDLLDVQEAAIDEARYRTLFTRDGLAVTTAVFKVRNARKQFLRLLLPEDAEIWTAFVDGRPEKPAMADDASVLLKIVNATRGFEVQLIYATPGSKIRGLGKVRGILPRPDILVTRSHWDVYLPTGVRYGSPSSNMDATIVGKRVSGGDLEVKMSPMAEGEVAQAIEPLRIRVPAAGMHYAFEKLYANQGGEEAWFSLTYASAAGAKVGTLLSLLGALLLLAGVLGWLRGDSPAWQRTALALAGSGALLLVGTVVFYGVRVGPAAMVVALSIGAWFAVRWLRRMREA